MAMYMRDTMDEYMHRSMRVMEDVVRRQIDESMRHIRVAAPPPAMAMPVEKEKGWFESGNKKEIISETKSHGFKYVLIKEHLPECEQIKNELIRPTKAVDEKTLLGMHNIVKVSV